MADLNAFENDREAVLADLAQGEFDYVEVASRVTVARLFRYLLDQGKLKQLARTGHCRGAGMLHSVHSR